MRKVILAGLLMASSSVFANVADSTDMSGDIDTMIHYAGLAVQDHAVSEVGMNPGSVRVAYSYSRNIFTASDTQKGCSFEARTTRSMKRLHTGHYWRVTEVGSNTCRQPTVQ